MSSENSDKRGYRRRHNVPSKHPDGTCHQVSPTNRTSPARVVDTPAQRIAVAGEDIPAGIMSKMTSEAPIDVGSVFWREDHQSAGAIITVINREGKMSSLSDASWMRHVQLAKNCHIQNVQIVYNDRESFCLQSSRTITKGELLYAWFTLETAKLFRIPFLSLINIQGGSQYKCHQCGCVYKDPNPLKIHLAFYCVTPEIKSSSIHNSTDQLFATTCNLQHASGSFASAPVRPFLLGSKNRLSAFRPPSHRNHHSPPICSSISPNTETSRPPLPSVPIFSSGYAFNPEVKEPSKKLKSIALFPNCHLHFSPSTSVPTPTTKNISTTPPSCDGIFTSSPPYQEISAVPTFLNYQNTLASIYSNFNIRLSRQEGVRFPEPANAVPEHCFLSTNLADASKSIQYRYPTAVIPVRPTIESPRDPAGVRSSSSSRLPDDLSNFGSSAHPEDGVFILEGKSRKRHKCFYCGKMYSRKYGLKIHIRTHTGYKPLKCKVCNRPFGDPSNLNKHVRLHAEGTTPYRCNVCGKILVRRRDLERHLKSRHPVKVSPNNCQQINL